MKTFLSVSFLIVAISAPSSADDAELAIVWKSLVREAAQEGKVTITTSHTGTFGGVKTMIPMPSLGVGVDGDAAFALFDACDSKFSKWCGANGGESHLSMMGKQKASGALSEGGHYLRSFKLRNGDYLELIYRAPTKGGGDSSMTIIFVDSDKFETSTGYGRKVSNSAGKATTDPPEVKR